MKTVVLLQIENFQQKNTKGLLKIHEPFIIRKLNLSIYRISKILLYIYHVIMTRTTLKVQCMCQASHRSTSKHKAHLGYAAYINLIVVLLNFLMKHHMIFSTSFDTISFVYIFRLIGFYGSILKKEDTGMNCHLSLNGHSST